jgi:hypothetical protein
MIAVPLRRQTCTRNLTSGIVRKPLAPYLREIHFPDLPSGIYDERIGHANFHLVFDKSTIDKSLQSGAMISSISNDISTARVPEAAFEDGP